jgi:hypothetical protein
VKAGNSSNNHKYGNSLRWKLLPSNGWWRSRRLHDCCSAVTCRICRSVEMLEFPVVKSYKISINPITNPNPDCSHSITCEFLQFLFRILHIPFPVISGYSFKTFLPLVLDTPLSVQILLLICAPLPEWVDRPLTKRIAGRVLRWGVPCEQSILKLETVTVAYFPKQYSQIN